MKCVYCSAEIDASARKCRHCGEWLVARKFRWSFWILLIVGVLLVGGILTAMTMADLNYAAKVYGTYGK